MKIDTSYSSSEMLLRNMIYDIDSEIKEYKNQRKCIYYDEINHIDDFDARMLAYIDMETDIIRKIISCGKTIVNTYRKLENGAIPVNIYHRFSFPLESGYASLCVSETEKSANDIIYDMISTVTSMVASIDNTK